MSNRTNLLITTALNTSPYSRATHDELYPSQFFTYGLIETKSRDDHINPASVLTQMENNKIKRRLLFDINCEDYIVVESIHHELTHLEQIKNLESLGYTHNSVYATLDSTIVSSIVWELQAHILQVEGALLSIRNDLNSGKSDNIELQKAIFEFHQNTEPFSLIQDCYKNIITSNQSLDNDSKIKDARKKSIQRFLEPHNNLNNPVVDLYIRGEIEEYSSAKQEELNNLNGLNLFLYMANKITKGVPLSTILETTMMQGKEFLSKQDWCEVLNGRNSAAVAENLVKRSKHHDLYQQVKRQNENKL